ncbi:alkene reductase [Roseibium sediminicola]|uniref:Alkene reductase n=1 Tax=Roseibium sediminicola TaxID=2933272 RepID=A0ABT0GZ04_9HYPH|nr:alkene reductase [Roseibium sp. CAU 1639]MCK7614654.1 alkene reductase [Roseibium sp. CAU 1639]
MAADLFSSISMGDLTLANRIVMAPMTRNRALPDGRPSPMMARHYADRASAGLIISESAPVSPRAVGYPFTPGLFTDSQADGWRAVTGAVHASGGRIFVQLQHCGRISHPDLQPMNALPVAPSAIRPEGKVYTYEGPKDYVLPAELDVAGIRAAVEEFRKAAALARQVGFDGVEVHGANGYLIDQFLRDGSNRRVDAYGGDATGRMRFLNEVLEAVLEVWPSESVGLRLTPENSFNSMSDSDPQRHFDYFAQELNRYRLAYLHVLEGDMMTRDASLDYARIRQRFDGPYIANNGYDIDRAQSAIRSDRADMVAFGLPFLANPDLVHRFRNGLPLNEADPATFYGGDETGYNDYPFHGTSELEPA